MGDGQTGGTTTDDDKVILVAELGDLPRGEGVRTAGEGLDGAEDGRADG